MAKPQSDSATVAVFHAVDAIKQAVPNLEGDVQIMDGTRTARVPLSNVPCFGDIKFGEVE